MRLKLASRKSDLARWQSVQVARAFEALSEHPHIEYNFKASMGDQNLDMPLASMSSKGVFTEDFYQDLSEGNCDLVVHSWKDLPVQEREATRIAMTMSRADARDIFLVTESAWSKALTHGELTVLTSSPRRIYNLSECLHDLLPGQLKIKFENVRGNVTTRLSKMQNSDCALILAKAGLDRLLQAEDAGFLEPGLSLRAILRDCRFVILPLSLNPGAAAQGALAVEIARSREPLAEFCSRLNDEKTFNCVNEERALLAGYGGGCQQKIGIVILPRPFGRVVSLRGLTEQGEVLSRWLVESDVPWSRAANAKAVFPSKASDNSWFIREPLAGDFDLSTKPALYVSRIEGVPSGFRPTAHQLVWTAGLTTWRKLAAQGVWVHGSSEGLGEAERPGLEILFGPIRWTKLTHNRGRATQGTEVVPTYQLKERAEFPNLRGKSHFFWMSATSFERARQQFPNEIEQGYNACGPGSTLERLQQEAALKRPIKVFAGLEQFLSETLPPTE